MLVIVGNTVFTTLKELRLEQYNIDKDLRNKLMIADSILSAEIDKLTIITGLVKEQNSKFANFIARDLESPTKIMLQTIVSKYDIDIIFLFDEDGVLLTTSSFTDFNPDPTLYAPLIAEFKQRIGLEEVASAALYGVGILEKNDGASILSLNSHLRLTYDTGDTCAYIVMCKLINKNQLLAKKIAGLAEAEMAIFDTSGQGVLSSLPDLKTISFANNQITTLSQTYFSLSKNLVDPRGELIGNLAVGLDNSSAIAHRNSLILANLIPVLIAIIIGLILFSLIKTLNRTMTKLRKTHLELEKARTSAEEANASKSEFLANMSHEIRTPINAILGMTSLSLQQNLAPKLRDYLNTIRNSSESLLGVINDILDFSKIEAGKMDIEQISFSLSHLMETVLDLFADKTADKDIELVYFISQEAPENLIGDPLRLRQILMNLIGNAIKFTDHGEVIVRVKPTETDTEKTLLVFSVQDTGVGICPEITAGLFSAFTQADTSTTRKYGGTGLGLTICKKLVAMMNGRIWVESEPGQGSTFSFTSLFNIHQEDKEDIPTTSNLLPDTLQGLHTLIISDNEILYTFLKESLSPFRYSVNRADNEDTALKMLSIHRLDYDLIFLDWRRRGIDALALVRTIKADPKTVKTPIILLTNLRRDEDMRKARNSPAAALIRKPVKRSSIINAIREGFGLEATTAMSLQKEQWLTADCTHIQGAQVLLVEDNKVNQKVAREILGTVHINVIIANNGLEAVRMVADNTYDAVLMDVQMPEMDGYEATEKIRQDKRFKNLPIIAMTAHAMERDQEKCLKAGMNEYVSKPIDPQILFKTLARWIAPDENRRPEAAAPASGPSADSDGRHNPQTPSLHLAGIDADSLMKRFNGKMEFIREILNDFSQYASIVNDIETSFNSGHMEEAEHHAHTLKGIAGNISALELSQAAYDLEIALKEKSSHDFSTLFAKVCEQLDIVLESISSLATPTVEKTPGNTSGTLDHKEIEKLIRQLNQNIRDHNLDAGDTLQSLIKNLPPEPELSVDLLSAQINDLKFKEAEVTLSEMVEFLKIPLDSQ